MYAFSKIHPDDSNGGQTAKFLKENRPLVSNVNDIKISPVAVSQVYKPAGTTDNIGDLLSTISISDLFNLVKQYDSEFKPKPVNEVLINNDDGKSNVFYQETI